MLGKLFHCADLGRLDWRSWGQIDVESHDATVEVQDAAKAVVVVGGSWLKPAGVFYVAAFPDLIQRPESRQWIVGKRCAGGLGRGRGGRRCHRRWGRRG